MDPLLILASLLRSIPSTLPVYVMGGLALDGHIGKLTRKHDDVDLICWRKDAEILKQAIQKMGYDVETNTVTKEGPLFEYRFETTDIDHVISVNIIDETENDSFEISFYHFPRLAFPKISLGPHMVTLEGVRFPAVGISMLQAFNENGCTHLERLRKDNPELYERLGYKRENILNDRKLIQGLIAEQKSS